MRAGSNGALALAMLLFAACGGARPGSENDASMADDPSSACRVIEADQPGRGRRVLLRCSAERVLAERQGDKIRREGIRVSFAAEGDVMHSGQLVRMTGSAANGLSDAAACRQVFVDALHKMQKLARKQGSGGISHVRSHLQKANLPPERSAPVGEYDCLVGNVRAHVALMADFVR